MVTALSARKNLSQANVDSLNPSFRALAPTHHPGYRSFKIQTIKMLALIEANGSPNGLTCGMPPPAQDALLPGSAIKPRSTAAGGPLSRA